MNLAIYKNKIFILILFSSIFTLIMYSLFVYSLGGPNFNSIPFRPEEAYKIVLHDVYNFSSNKINSIPLNDMKDKFTYQSVRIESNGTVYLLNSKDSSIIKTIDNITAPSANGIHFAWEITINNTKFYVDSTSGQIISTSK